MTEAEKIAKYEALLKRVYVLINEGQGIAAYLEVDGYEATDIYNEIRDLKLDA